MGPRETLVQALGAAITAALSGVPVLVNHAERVPESALPTVIIKRRSESRELLGINVRCELSLNLHILTRGRDRINQADTIEDAIRAALSDAPPRHYGALRISVDDADFDDEMAADPHETTRLGLTVWYDRAR